MELIPLKEFVKVHCEKNLAEAARRLDMDYMQVRRWFKKQVKAGLQSRKLARLKGVELP